MAENFREASNESLFKGRERDSLSQEASYEMFDIINRWMELENPVEMVRKWGKHYYGREEDFVPINYAISLWETAPVKGKDALWPFVKGEFGQYQDVLDQHGANSEIIEDVKKRLHQDIPE